MASEMRRMARALVESRDETFASRYSIDESKQRLRSALRNLEMRRLQFRLEWRAGPGGTLLEAHFAPAPRTRDVLSATSIVLVLLIAAAVWAAIAGEEDSALRFLVPIGAVLGLLGFPFFIVALGSQREAEEAGIRRAIRRALVDEPPQSQQAR